MKIHPNILQRRNDVFLPGQVDTFYTFERFHINGSRILSRSFHVEPFAEEEDGESASVDIDPGAVETGAQMWIKADEGSTINAEEFEEDERNDVADVVMAPMADILNARNGYDNVCLYPLTRNPH